VIKSRRLSPSPTRKSRPTREAKILVSLVKVYMLPNQRSIEALRPKKLVNW
jgi:hypothetical protein